MQKFFQIDLQSEKQSVVGVQSRHFKVFY
jgi:hypothetical protein